MSRVTYYYDSNIGDYDYGENHPMKPMRIRLAHHLIGSYGLLDRMTNLRPVSLDAAHMQAFHTGDYVDFLASVEREEEKLEEFRRAERAAARAARADSDSDDDDSDLDDADDTSPRAAPSPPASLPEELRAYCERKKEYGFDPDCPVFRGLFDFCKLYSGASVGAAWRLNQQRADIAINWSGGLHHAKKAEVSGFCYTNDIVLAILELLRYHRRVLYIDIDVHHGDGVEEAFYTTDRVMTVSFHQHGDNFFPQTGALTDRGVGAGKGYSLNFPLAPGVGDAEYNRAFRSVIGGVMQHYRPEAIVLQCGADSLTDDKLGELNLTLHGHGDCAAFCKSFGVPLLMLGGGGYTVPNVARAWTFETAIAVGQQDALGDELPYNERIRHFGPGYKLHIQPSADRPNLNHPHELARVEAALLQQLKELQGAPNVALNRVEARVAAGDFAQRIVEESRERAREEHAMDASGDGVPEGTGPQHRGEFYAHARDQDASTYGAGGQQQHAARSAVNASLAPPPAGSSGAATASGVAPMEQ